MKLTVSTHTRSNKKNSANASVDTNGATLQANNIQSDQWRTWVNEAAYFIAEQRGFYPGQEVEHWFLAEAEITRLIESGQLR